MTTTTTTAAADEDDVSTIKITMPAFHETMDATDAEAELRELVRAVEKELEPEATTVTLIPQKVLIKD